MGNWGDETDPEVQGLKEYEGRFTVNFKKIYMDVDEIVQKTLTIDDKHPKDSLIKLWAGTMVGFLVLFALSYQVLFIITVPFMAFYFIALLRIYKAWKTFRYNGATFWLMTIGGLILAAAIGLGGRTLILHYFF